MLAAFPPGAENGGDVSRTILLNREPRELHERRKEKLSCREWDFSIRVQRELLVLPVSHGWCISRFQMLWQSPPSLHADAVEVRAAVGRARVCEGLRARCAHDVGGDGLER